MSDGDVYLRLYLQPRTSVGFNQAVIIGFWKQIVPNLEYSQLNVVKDMANQVWNPRRGSKITQTTLLAQIILTLSGWIWMSWIYTQLSTQSNYVVMLSCNSPHTKYRHTKYCPGVLWVKNLVVCHNLDGLQGELPLICDCLIARTSSRQHISPATDKKHGHMVTMWMSTILNNDSSCNAESWCLNWNGRGNFKSVAFSSWPWVVAARVEIVE